MADDTGNTTDTNRRFEIFVPSPKARINLGAPNTDTTGPFGYTGLSIQSDVHLFIDANKHTLFQTGQNYCGQVGGKWLQYSNADMILSSTANMNVSADKKIVIASGAGQGQITALDHGSTPRVVPYNALELHYRTDRLQTSLFEFFHGRRKRDEYTGKLKAVLAFGGASTEYFDGSGKASTQEQMNSQLAGGFSFTSGDSLRELYPVTTARQTNKFDEPADDPGDPIALLDPFVHKKVLGGSKKAADLVWGFSGYLSRFDPYARINTKPLTNPLAKGLAGFRNLLAKLRRFADVCTKYAYLLTDNFLLKRAQAAMAAIDNLSKATIAAHRLVDLTFGSFLPGGSDGFRAAFVDERQSGVEARPAAATGLQAAGEAERAKVAGRTASIQSARGPFDLRGETRLIIEWGNSLNKRAEIDLTQGRAATGAELPMVISGQALLALPVSVHIDLAKVGPSRDPIVPEWIEEAEIVEWIAGELGVSPTELAPATRGEVQIRPPSSIVFALMGTPSELEANGREFTERVPLNPFAPGAPRTATLTLGAFVALTVQRPVYAFRLSIDGAAVTVSVDTSAVDVLAEGETRAVIEQALRAAVGDRATLTAMSSDGSITVQSSRRGATSHIAVLDGDPAFLRGLDLDVGSESRGEDAIPGLGHDELSSVSVQQLAELIGAHPKLAVSVSGGTLTLRSQYAPSPDADSQVKVSGGAAGVIFDGVSTEDTVTTNDTSERMQNLAEADAEYKKLVSWNHELQKLPEDTRNLTRPLRNAVNDAVAAMSSLEKAVESGAEFVGGDVKGLPTPPEAIGLIADQGITLGTRDRIVGVGGKGVVFIADGGSGEEDHNKFIPGIEQFVNLSLSWDPIDRKLAEKFSDPVALAKEKKRSKSLGFRVLSDSHVDLFGTHVAQIMALGRGKLAAPGADGKSIAGTGVARIAGSYAAEVAGYRKVVVSARNRGDDDKTGGRVELAGQTIAIGGMNLPGDVTDFAADANDAPTFGVHALDVEAFAGAEHLSADEKDALKADFATYAWPEALRDGGSKGHPNTKRVFVHAEKETVIQVGTFLVRVADGEGVMVGTRKPDAAALSNELDMEQPFLIVRAETVLVAQQDGGAMIHLEKDSVTIQEKDRGATVTLAGGKATIVSGPGGSKGTVELSGSGVEVKKGGSTLKLLDSGVQAQGGTIKWG